MEPAIIADGIRSRRWNMAHVKTLRQETLAMMACLWEIIAAINQIIFDAAFVSNVWMALVFAQKRVIAAGINFWPAIALAHRLWNAALEATRGCEICCSFSPVFFLFKLCPLCVCVRCFQIFYWICLMLGAFFDPSCKKQNKKRKANVHANANVRF